LAEIDDELRAFLHSGGALVIGTHDGSLNPEIARGWGLRVLDGRTVELCLGLPSSRRTLANLEADGRIAATFVAPIEYRQVQLKGRVVAVLEPTPEDFEWVERSHEGFMRRVEPLGIPPDLCPRFWSYDEGLAKVRFTVEEAYDQTPGPRAGRPL
jgi:hypothetical protein